MAGCTTGCSTSVGPPGGGGLRSHGLYRDSDQGGVTVSARRPPEVSRFSIFYTRAGPGDNEGWLVRELRSIEGCDGYGDGIAVAARGDLRGAVVFTVTAGSVPAAIHKVMMNGPSIGVKAVATDTGFAIIGTSPVTYDGFVEAIGLEAYGGGIAPPVRCEIGDN